tara:strand:- start:114 stop:446 length:333 start_codon:yes stop_codon:yes gene_type:complete
MVIETQEVLMTTRTFNPQKAAIDTRQNNNNSRFHCAIAWARRFYEAYQVNRQDRLKIRQLEKLDDMVLGDVTGLTRAQLEIALRLPAGMARREIARNMRGDDIGMFGKGV